eukprot:6478443-Amphidinium_carterae.3
MICHCGSARIYLRSAFKLVLLDSGSRAGPNHLPHENKLPQKRITGSLQDPKAELTPLLRWDSNK